MGRAASTGAAGLPTGSTTRKTVGPPSSGSIAGLCGKEARAQDDHVMRRTRPSLRCGAERGELQGGRGATHGAGAKPWRVRRARCVRPGTVARRRSIVRAGRLAQLESAWFTPRRSAVRSRHRPSSSSTAKSLRSDAMPALALAAALVALSAPLNPPVIHEPFTPLPCTKNPQTTVALEGCTESEISSTDTKINARVRVVFGLLRTETRGRRSSRAKGRGCDIAAHRASPRRRSTPVGVCSRSSTATAFLRVTELT